MTPLDVVAPWALAAASLLTAAATLRRLRLDRAKANVDQEVSFASAARGLLADVEPLKDRLRISEERADKAEDHSERCERELAAGRERNSTLEARVSALETLLPLVLLGARLQECAADLCEVLDELGPCIISS